MEKVPGWAQTGKPIDASAIPAADYGYLAAWLKENAKPAQEYFIDLFKRHQVVIAGEFHTIKEHKDFILDLIPRLYHEAGVRAIGWEFSRHTDNEKLESLVTSQEYDAEAALEFARDQLDHGFNSKEHWDFIERIWRLNKSLEPGREKMRFLGLDMEVDMARWCIVSKTQTQDSPEFQEMLAKVLKRDRTMAEQVEKGIIDKGLKGVVFVGKCHDFTHYEFPQNVNLGREIMGNLLYKKFGDRVFQVWLSGGLFPIIERVVGLVGHIPFGFDLYTSPFANILTPSSWSDAPEIPLSCVARGYIYLGPQSTLHYNTPIKGFVTEEMFERYRHYYEVDFGRSFKDAHEVDECLQAHRFSKP